MDRIFLLLFSSFLILLSQKRTLFVKISFSHIALLSYILYALAINLFAIDRITSYTAAYWHFSIFIALFIITQFEKSSHEKYKRIFISIFLILNILTLFFPEENSFVIKNINVLGSSILFALILLYPTKNKAKYGQFLIFGLFVFFIYYFFHIDQKGLVLLFLMGLLGINSFLYWNIYISFSFFLFISLFVTFLLYPDIDLSRTHLFNVSLKLSISNPFGVGLNEWLNVACKESRIIDLCSNPSYGLKLTDHNIFTLLLVEVGFVGLILFVTPLVRTVLSNYVTLNKINNGYKVLIVVYLISSTFLLSNVHRASHISIAQLMAFYAFFKLNLQKGYRLEIRTWILSSLIFAMLIFNFVMRANIVNNRDLSIRGDDKSLMSKFIWKNDFLEPKQLSSQVVSKNSLKAIHYKNNGRYDLAKEYYSLAFAQLPCNDQIKFGYANLLSEICESKEFRDSLFIAAYHSSPHLVEETLQYIGDNINDIKLISDTRIFCNQYYSRFSKAHSAIYRFIYLTSPEIQEMLALDNLQKSKVNTYYKSKIRYVENHMRIMDENLKIENKKKRRNKLFLQGKRINKVLNLDKMYLRLLRTDQRLEYYSLNCDTEKYK